MSTSAAADVVVIGAGHNGLVAANYLVDAGLTVILVERGKGIGGMTRTLASIPEAPHHLINYGAVDPVFWTTSVASNELALGQHGLRYIKVDPAFVYLHPDGESIAFWQSAARTADDIGRFSRRDAVAYLELAQLFSAALDVGLPLFSTNPTRPNPLTLLESTRCALRHRRELGDLLPFVIGSGHDAISERFEHPIVRSALHVASGCVYPPSYPGSSIQMLILGFVHRHECLRPVGGTQAIPNALAARFTAAGGAILTDAKVTQIGTNDGRATGVVLADGREIQARKAVLASCDVKQTLTTLLPGGILPPVAQRRAGSMPTLEGWGQLKVDIACSGRVDMSRFEKRRSDGANLRAASHFIGTEDGIERGYRRAAAGLLPDPEDFGFYNAVPSAVDPSQAPEGQDTIYLINVTMPSAPEGGWTTETREKAISATVERAALFYGGMLDLEIGRRAFTNEEMAAEVGAESQSHVLWTINRMGPLRPARGFGGYRTPVAGLYLGSAGTHPGPGVTGAPGLVSAKEIIHDIRAEGGSPVRRQLRSRMGRIGGWMV